VDIWQEGLHPDRATKWSLAPTMKVTWILTLIAFVVLCILLLIVQYQTKKTEARYEIIRQKYLGNLT
jgi:preprotein translocase subunit SecG